MWVIFVFATLTLNLWILGKRESHRYFMGLIGSKKSSSSRSQSNLDVQTLPSSEKESVEAVETITKMEIEKIMGQNALKRYVKNSKRAK